jgi:hypothetical protein
MIREGENIKLKNHLKKVFENEDFETSFQDEVISWDGTLITVYEKYRFKYYMEVGKVLGKGTKTVASINVILTEMKREGEDFMYDWAEDQYDENTWYINQLDNILHEETFKYYPISIYLNFYSYDEYENLPLDQKNL